MYRRAAGKRNFSSSVLYIVHEQLLPCVLLFTFSVFFCLDASLYSFSFTFLSILLFSIGIHYIALSTYA